VLPQLLLTKTSPDSAGACACNNELRLGGGFLGRGVELRLGAKPVLDIVAVFAATLFIECIRPAANLLFMVGVGYNVRGLFCGRFFCHVGHSFLALGAGQGTHLRGQNGYSIEWLIYNIRQSEQV